MSLLEPCLCRSLFICWWRFIVGWIWSGVMTELCLLGLELGVGSMRFIIGLGRGTMNLSFVGGDDGLVRAERWFRDET